MTFVTGTVVMHKEIQIKVVDYYIEPNDEIGVIRIVA